MRFLKRVLFFALDVVGEIVLRAHHGGITEVGGLYWDGNQFRHCIEGAKDTYEICPIPNCGVTVSIPVVDGEAWRDLAMIEHAATRPYDHVNLLCGIEDHADDRFDIFGEES